jgi:hypothetical protein
MLVKIGEKQWIKADTINAIKLCNRGLKWAVCVYTDERLYDHDTYDDKEKALQNLDYLAMTVNHKIGK